MLPTEKNKLGKFADIATGSTDQNKVLTVNGSGTATWVLPPSGTVLGYTASATDGRVNNTSTGTYTSIPAATGTNAGLMIPADLTKLSKIPTPPTTAAQVLTSKADGTSEWIAPAAGGGGGSSDIIYSPADVGSSLGAYGTAFLKVRASGAGITVQRSQGALPGGITNKLTIYVPNGVQLSSIRINGDNILLGKTQADTPPAYVYIDIVYAASSNINTGLDDFWPPVSYSFINRVTTPYKYGAPGAPGQNILMYVNGYTSNTLSLQWTINIATWTAIMGF